MQTWQGGWSKEYCNDCHGLCIIP